MDSQHRIEQVGQADAMRLGHQSVQGPVTIEAPRPASRYDLQAGFVVMVENFIGDAQLGEYFRVFVSYGIIAVTLLLHAWKRRSEADARQRSEGETERAEEEAAS